MQENPTTALRPAFPLVSTLILEREDRWKYELGAGDVANSTRWGKSFGGKVILLFSSLLHEISETSSEDFQKHLGACAYQPKLSLQAAYKAAASAADLHTKHSWFGDMMVILWHTRTFLHLVWPHYHFVLVRQHKSFQENTSVLCCWISPHIFQC